MRRGNNGSSSKTYTDALIDRVKKVKGNGSFGDGLDDVNVTADANELERGMGFSYTDYAKMRYDYQMWQKNNEYNEQMYNQYQSPAAMMRQYQDAGLNPALMYQGASGSGTALGSSSPADSSSADYSVPQTKTDKFSRIMSVIASMVGVGSQLGNVITQAKQRKDQADLWENQKYNDNLRTVTEANKTDAETDGIKKDNARKDMENYILAATSAGTITKSNAEAAIAEYNRQVLAGVPPEKASQNILTTYRLTEANVDNAEKLGKKIDAETANIEALTQKYVVEEAELWSRISLQGAEKKLADANTSLTDQLAAQESLNTEVRQYAQDHDLPYDQPVVVMTHQRLNEALAKAYIDMQSDDAEVKSKAKDAVKSLTKSIANIEANAEKVASGRMTKAQKTEFWAQQMQKVFGSLTQAASIYFGTKGAGKAIGQSTVKPVEHASPIEIYDVNTGKFTRYK